MQGPPERFEYEAFDERTAFGKRRLPKGRGGSPKHVIGLGPQAMSAGISCNFVCAPRRFGAWFSPLKGRFRASIWAACRTAVGREC